MDKKEAAVLAVKLKDLLIATRDLGLDKDSLQGGLDFSLRISHEPEMSVINVVVQIVND